MGKIKRATADVLYILLTASLVSSLYSQEVSSPNNTTNWPPKVLSMADGQAYHFSLQNGEIIYCNFTIENISEEADVRFNVFMKSYFLLKPEIYISLSNPYPNSTKNSDFKGSVRVPISNLTKDQTIYASYTCTFEYLMGCDFIVSVRYLTEFVLPANFEADLTSDDETIEKLIINVPEEILADYYLISVYSLRLPNDECKRFQVYINKGNQMPSISSHDFITKKTWLSTHVEFIHSDNKLFCKNCNYSLMIESSSLCPLGAGLKAMNASTELILNQGEPFNQTDPEIVDAQRNLTYQLNIKSILDNADASLIIDVFGSFGKVLLCLKPDTAPHNLNDCEWKLDANPSGHIQLSHKNLVARKIKSSKLYLIIHGKTICKYALKVYISNKRILRVSEPQMGSVMKNEVENYMLEILGLTSNTTLRLIPEIGNPDLFVKGCMNEDNCSFTESDVQSILNGTTATSDVFPVTLFSNNTHSEEIIRLSNSKCKILLSDTTRSCLYSIGVFGKSEGESHYTLQADGDGDILELIENLPVKDQLRLGQTQFFLFQLRDDSGVDAVNFQLTPISGEVDTSIAFHQLIQDKGVYPATYFQFQDLITFSKNADNGFNTLKGSYQVSVLGLTGATYSLTVFFDYSEILNNDWSFIKLYEGTPQKMVLGQNGIGYFSFRLINQTDNPDTGAEIIFKPTTGFYFIYITNNKSTPSNEIYQWKFEWTGVETAFIISPKDPSFSPDEVYLVAVYPKQSPLMNNNTNFAFLIAYVSESNMLVLQPGIPYHGQINSKRTIFFKFEVFSDDTELLITKLSESDNFELYLSVVESNPLPNANNYNFTTRGTIINFIKLNQTQISGFCPYGYCHFYLGASTSSIYNVSVTITLKKKGSLVILTEGHPITMACQDENAENELINFYHYPQIEIPELMTIFADPQYHKLAIFFSIVNLQHTARKKDWVTPNPLKRETYLLVAVAEPFQSLYLNVSQETIKSCTPDEVSHCVIFLSATCSHKLIANISNESNSSSLEENMNLSNKIKPDSMKQSNITHQSSFTVMITSELIKIPAGKMINTHVDEKTYKYFSFTVNRPQCTILITATSTSESELLLFLSYGRQSRPTKEVHEFGSSTLSQTQILQVGNIDVLPKISMEGHWVVGVFSNSFTSYSLTVLYEEVKIVELAEGAPVEIELSAGEFIFFRYFTTSKSSFLVRLTKEFGDADLYMKTFNVSSNLTLIESLPNSSNHMWKGRGTGVKDTISISNTDPYFCYHCTYLIGVAATSKLHMSIYASIKGEPLKLIVGKQISSYLQAGDYDLYQFKNYKTDQVMEISGIPYSGSPVIYIHHSPTVNQTNFLWHGTVDPLTGYIYIRINDTAQIGVDPHDIPSHPSSIYILVAASNNSDSSYAIEISNKNSSIHLHLGHISYGFLLPGESNIYQFKNFDGPTTKLKRIKLTINVFEDRFSASRNKNSSSLEYYEFSVLFKSIGKNNEDGPTRQIQPVSSDNATYSQLDHLKFSSHIQYSAKAGYYLFNITNPANLMTMLNYSIVINQNEAHQLLLNSYHLSRLLVGDEEIYVIQISSPGILAITVFECIGEIRFKATTSYENMLNKIFELEPAHNEKSLVGTLKVQPGTVYLSAKAVKGYVDSDVDPAEEAVFKLHTTLFDESDFLPHDYLLPGNGGRLIWKIDQNNQDKASINLQWDQIQHLNVENDPRYDKFNISYSYKVILAREAVFANSMARCEYIPNKLGGEFSNKSSFYSIVSENFQSNSVHLIHHLYLALDQKYFVTVVAQVSAKKENKIYWELPILYETSELYLPSGSSIDVWNPFFVAGVLLIGVILTGMSIGLFYYYQKYKRVHTKLQYELADVRNVANLS